MTTISVPARGSGRGPAQRRPRRRTAFVVAPSTAKEGPIPSELMLESRVTRSPPSCAAPQSAPSDPCGTSRRLARARCWWSTHPRTQSAPRGAYPRPESTPGRPQELVALTRCHARSFGLKPIFLKQPREGRLAHRNSHHLLEEAAPIFEGDWWASLLGRLPRASWLARRV
jgi:hypothetical protein